jgi:hypothetical protein
MFGAEIARELGVGFTAAMRWVGKFKYPVVDGRRLARVKRRKSKADWSTVDWSMKDVRIAEQLGVSPQRVGVVRASRGLSRTGPAKNAPIDTEQLTLKTGTNCSEIL